MQTKLESFFESVVQVTVGTVLSVITQLVVFPLYGWEVSLITSLEISAIFLIISLVRQFILRRLFNLLNRKKNQ